MSHPYKTAPHKAFWSKAVQLNPDPISLMRPGAPLISKGDRVVSAGSCFAANLVPYLKEAGLSYLKTEGFHPLWVYSPPENLSYGKFSAAYGNIYTSRQLLQLMQRALGIFRPAEDRFTEKGRVIDVFRPGLRYSATNNEEFDSLQKQHFKAVIEAFTACDVFIYTLGLTEAWVSTEDGSVFPACPGTIAGTFDPTKHKFQNFSTFEVAEDLSTFMGLLHNINQRVRVILTVSPVPLVATATDDHVIEATVYSKSALRVAAAEVSRRYRFVSYFPAYEIITGPQAPENFFEADRRTPSKVGIDAVMRAFLHGCGIEQGEYDRPDAAETRKEAPLKRPLEPSSGIEKRAGTRGAGSALGNAIVDAECEEAMADPG